jgi:hypothetical protein
MPDQDSEPGKPIPIGPEEPRMEWRLLLAFLLTGLVMFLAPYIYHRLYGPPPQATKTAAKTAPEARQQAKPAAESAKPVAAPATLAPVSAAKLEEFVVETDVYRVHFSNRGAVVLRWELKKYKDAAGKTLELVNTAAAPQVGYPFALEFKDRKPPMDPIRRCSLRVPRRTVWAWTTNFLTGECGCGNHSASRNPVTCGGWFPRRRTALAACRIACCGGVALAIRRWSIRRLVSAPCISIPQRASS